MATRMFWLSLAVASVTLVATATVKTEAATGKAAMETVLAASDS